MQSAPGLRSHFSGVWKNNLLFASPSIRRPTVYKSLTAIQCGNTALSRINIWRLPYTGETPPCPRCGEPLTKKYVFSGMYCTNCGYGLDD